MRGLENPMITIKKGKVKTIKTKPAFSNLAVRGPVPRTRRNVNKRLRKPARGRVDQPLLSSSKVEATRAAMAQYYPAEYRGAFMPSPDLVAMPMNSITVTDKWQFSTILSSSGSYENILVVKPVLLSMYIYGTAYTGANISAITGVNNSALASITANAESYRIVAIDVRIQPVLKSADIGGEWGAYNFPFGAGPVGLNAGNVDTYAGVSRGIFTDADPSARFVWLPGDSSDSVLRNPSQQVAANNTAVWFSARTTVATTFDMFITTTINMKPNVVAMSAFPGHPRNVDGAAFARGLQAFSDVIQENSQTVTNPVKADAQHPGMLRRVARAVADTIKESEMLIAAVTGSPSLAKGISGVAGALGGLLRAKQELAVIVSLAKLSVADRLREHDDSKVVHEDVLHALDVLARVEMNRTRGDVVFDYETPPPNVRAPTIRKVG